MISDIRSYIMGLDAVLRHTQDVIYIKYIIHLDAVLRRTQDAIHTNSLYAWMQFYVVPRTQNFVLDVSTRSEYWMQFYVVPRTHKFDINKGGPGLVTISRVWMQFYVVPRTLKHKRYHSFHKHCL